MVSQHKLLNRVTEVVEQGNVKSSMTEHLGVLNAVNLAKAHDRLESRQMIGKLVLSGIEV